VVALAAAPDRVSTLAVNDGPFAPAQAPGAVSVVNHSPAAETDSMDAVDEPELSTKVKSAPPTELLPNSMRPDEASRGLGALHVPHVPSPGLASAADDAPNPRAHATTEAAVKASNFRGKSDPSCWADRRDVRKFIQEGLTRQECF
jgi:hypothetical protein